MTSIFLWWMRCFSVVVSGFPAGLLRYRISPSRISRFWARHLRIEHIIGPRTGPYYTKLACFGFASTYEHSPLSPFFVENSMTAFGASYRISSSKGDFACAFSTNVLDERTARGLEDTVRGGIAGGLLLAIALSGKLVRLTLGRRHGCKRCSRSGCLLMRWCFLDV